MATRRRKKIKEGWEMFDNFDDFLESVEKSARSHSEGAEEGENNTKIMEQEGDKVNLRDFIVEQKISAFVRSYEPCNEGDAGYEQFDDGRLREVFKAYVCGLGDPLKLYIEDLQMEGFRMDCSMATGEPCIFARRIPTPTPLSMDGSK